jgi:tetratricopeptide (TPR) repeat protein
MRRLLTLAAALALGLVLAGRSWAGLYNTAEPAPEPSNDYRKFRDQLNDLRRIAVPREQSPGGVESARRQHYLRQVADLEAWGRKFDLSVQDRVNLGEYYVRLQQYEKAVEVLTGAVARDRTHFMALSNLATALHLAGRPERAVSYLRQSLQNWPTYWPGLTTPELAWYRRAEVYYLALLESRLRERQADGLDNVFPGLQFLDERGEYSAGTLAGRSWDAVPTEAVRITEQLVYWLPFDDRVAWLLAELFNAHGEVDPAYRIMDDLVYGRRVNFRDLRRHRQVLLDARKEQEEFASKVGEGAEMFKEQLLWAVAPRGGPGSGVGSWLHEVGWAAAAEAVRRAESGGPPVAAPAERAAGAAEPARGFDLRLAAVSFVAGALVGSFLVLQVREMRRRRQTELAGRG